VEKKIIRWLSKQVALSGAKGVVLGLSGGIDSCVAAALVKRAVGKNRLLALILPIHSHKQDALDAIAFAKKLGIRVMVIDLSKIYDSLLKILPQGGKTSSLNLKPRLRMLVLYYFANKLNYLVCGTSNKSELSVGYFTKYGDGAADVLPLGGLLKREVYDLARALCIPDKIIKKAPTAGLWPRQTDEAEMGITYAELDEILAAYLGKRKQRLAKDKVVKVTAMIERSGHKREKPLVCPV
jgi:NAD+ synthase